MGTKFSELANNSVENTFLNFSPCLSHEQNGLFILYSRFPIFETFPFYCLLATNKKN